MKTSAIILVVYFMALFVMPCTDFHGRSSSTEMAATAPTIVQESHDHGHEHSADDTCSPFCVCACCGITIDFSTYAPKIPSVSVFLSTQVPSFKSNLYSNEFIFIWKPPKIS